MLRFFYSPGACSIASHIALEESGAEYEGIPVNIRRGDNRTPEYLAINPRGFVPVLQTDRGTITENTAILSYVAQSFPEARLFPTPDAFGQAQVTSFNAFLATTIHITLRHFSRPRLFAEGEVAHAALRAKVPEMINYYFGIIEDIMKDGRPFIHGDRFSASDPYLFIYTSYLHWRGDRGDLSAIPNVIAHRKRVLERPATQRVLELENIGDPATLGGDRIVVLDSPEFLAAMEQGVAYDDNMQLSSC